MENNTKETFKYVESDKWHTLTKKELLDHLRFAEEQYNSLSDESRKDKDAYTELSKLLTQKTLSVDLLKDLANQLFNGNSINGKTPDQAVGVLIKKINLFKVLIQERF